MQHLYRGTDQSYILESGKLDILEVWARLLHPRLTPGTGASCRTVDSGGEHAVELKRSDYNVPEMNLQVVDGLSRSSA